MDSNKTMRTATGKEFPEAWDGVSIIDGVLRIALVGVEIDVAHEVFKQPEETQTLTRIWDGQESVYTGYTDYRGFTKTVDGEIIVALGPEV